MLNEYERKRLETLKARFDLLRSLVGTDQKAKQVIEWVISDWHQEINSLINEDRL